jgi:anaerobic magnesium-protoporphyrin IX monomethyl ester cyclase
MSAGMSRKLPLLNKPPLKSGNAAADARSPITSLEYRPRWTPDPRGKIVLFQPRVGYMDNMRSKPALPLSLLHAASLAAEKYPIVLIDQRVQTDWRARLERELRASPLLLGITCYTGPMIARALDAASVARAVAPDVPIVWGGVHVGLLPEQSLQHSLVDLVVRGEGELSLLELADALAQRKSLRGVRALSYVEDGEYVATPSGEYLDLSDAPEIPYHLVDVERYMPLYEGRRSLYMESSRGCPFACTYCYNVYFNDRKWRAQSPERVIERVRHVKRNHGVEDVYFTDDDFFINPKRSRAIVEGLSKIDVSWQVQGSDIVCISKMDDDFFHLLQKSGFRRFTIGIETGSPRMRALMKKAGSVELIVQTFERLANYGFIIFGSFISNTPGETLADIRLSVDLMRRLHQVNPHFRNSPVYHYTPFPGTPMFEQAVEAGFEPPENFEGWADFSYEGNGCISIGSQESSFYERLYLTTLFNDRKVDEYTVPWYVRLGAQLYRPIAQRRLRHLYFDFMPEMSIARRFLRAS